MRIRPFFWFLFALVCMGILIFATLPHSHVPVRLQVHVDQETLASSGMTSLDLNLTDPQGIPIEQAQVIPKARMTNMDMITRVSQVNPRGQGNYTIKLLLYMAGPWEITILAQAHGFAPQEKILYVQVK
jgi:hypothetical protein